MRHPLRFALLSALAVAGVAALAPATALAAEKPPTRGLRFPSLTPDGKTVVFAWRGDIWRAPVAGGTATRLTIHEAQDTKPRVSPDGKWIAFSSKRTGNYDVFLMPIEGGEPKQVTTHSGTDIVTDWSPDGKRLLLLTSRDPGPYGTDVYEMDIDGGTPRRITRDGGRDASYAPDGKTIVYARGFNTVFQDGYRGTANYDLWVTDVAGASPRRLTNTLQNELNPAIAADGQTVYFLAEAKGRMNFWSVPLAGGEAKALTQWTDDHARRSTLAWDRKTEAFEKDGRLYTVDLSVADPKAVAIPVTVESDVRNSGFDVRTVTEGAEHVAVSPDGAQMAVALRGDLWLLAAAGGDATRLTSGPATDDWPRFSPDGKKLLYYSDAKGNDDVYLLDLATKETKQLTSAKEDDAFPTWAPDGKRIVYTSQRTGNKDLFLLDLESGEERQLTRDGKDDDDATVSADGKWVAYDSGRGGAQAIWIMPLAVGDAQARQVSSGTGFYQVPSLSPDGSMVAYEEMDPTSGGTGGLWVSKSTGGPSVQISRDGAAAFWSPRGDWIYFSAERNGEKNVYRVRAPQSIEVGERVPFIGRVPVDRRREFGDLFDEAWHKLKDGFYDPSMHGVDWNALKDKYRPLAVDAEIKDEFYNVVSQMLGELNASHLGIYPGSDDEEADGAPHGPSTGYLGLDLDGVAQEGGGRKITGVQTKGPADEAGLRVGDVLKSVAGAPVKAETDLDKVLGGTAGKEIPITFAKGDGSGERTVKLKAVPQGALSKLLYDLWIERSKKAVEEQSKGEAAYLHLSQMDQPNLARFNATLSALNQNKKVKALVLDVRNNGGGNIHQQLLDALASKPFIAFEPRGVPRQVQPALRWGKPVVLLINERSFSDAEVFPYGFKQLKLGKVVGVATAGGVIGTNDITLSDGSKFRIPRVGWFGLNGENLEHLGVKPDVTVEETAEDRLAGRDPQLDKAIEVILSELHPAPAPEKKPEEAPAKPAEAPKVEAKVPEAPKPDAPKTEAPKAPEAKPVEAPRAPEAKPVEAPKPVAVPAEPAKPAASPPAPVAPAPAPSEAPKATEAASATPTKDPSASTDFENPLFDAKVGEWMKVRVAGRGGERVFVASVTDVSDGEVEVSTTAEGGESVAAKRREPRTKELSFRAERAADDRRETLTIAGHELPCLVVTLKRRNGATERRWITNAIPVTGVARVELEGKVVSEAVEWGVK